MLKKTPHHLTTNSRAGSSQKPLRILFTSYRSHKFTGGQGVYLRLATSALADLGHSVSVVSGPPYPDLDSRVELIKLPSLDLYERPRTFAGMPPPPVADMTTRIDWYEYLDHISGGFPEPYTFGRRFARFIKSNSGRFDVIHDNQTLCYGLLDAAKLGIPVIGMIHHPITYDRRIALDAADSWKLRLLISRWYSFLRMQKKVARQLDPVIVVSKRTEDDVVKDFGLDRSRLKLVYHGVDHEFWSPRTTISRSKNMLVTVASADVPLKGLIYLLEALAILRPSWPKLRLTVIGKLREGPTKKRIDALQLADRVEFISGVTDEEIAQLYAKATMAVTPSVYEGFGYPAAEAMACGVPTVATTGGALPEIVGDAGKQVPVKDPAALATAIDSLMRAPDERARLGQAARERIVRVFGGDRMARDMVAIYEEQIRRHADN